MITNEKKGIVIYAFIATGKTTLAKKNSQFFDLESSRYHYLDYNINKFDNEKNKGDYKKINPDWPNNYYNAIDDALTKHDYILIAFEGLKHCQSSNINYISIFPDISEKNEYLNRMKSRGNNLLFIEHISKNFEIYLKTNNEDNNPNCLKKIILKKGEFLEDVIHQLR